MQQKIDTLQDVFEQAMKIEAMAGYPHKHRGGVASSDPAIMGLHH